MSYNDPTYAVREELHGSAVLSVSDAVFQTFVFFQKVRIKKVHSAVVVAGTAAGAGYYVLSGTNTSALINPGTWAAGTISHSAALDYVVPANGIVQLKGVATDGDVLKIAPTIEYDVLPDAVQS